MGVYESEVCERVFYVRDREWDCGRENDYTRVYVCIRERESLCV